MMMEPLDVAIMQGEINRAKALAEGKPFPSIANLKAIRCATLCDLLTARDAFYAADGVVQDAIKLLTND